MVYQSISIGVVVTEQKHGDVEHVVTLAWELRVIRLRLYLQEFQRKAFSRRLGDHAFRRFLERDPARSMYFTPSHDCDHLLHDLMSQIASGKIGYASRIMTNTSKGWLTPNPGRTLTDAL